MCAVRSSLYQIKKKTKQKAGHKRMSNRDKEDTQIQTKRKTNL